MEYCLNNCFLYLKNYEDLELILNKPLKDEKHQTRVSLLLELVSDAYLTANRTGDLRGRLQVPGSIRSEISITDEL